MSVDAVSTRLSVTRESLTRERAAGMAAGTLRFPCGEGQDGGPPAMSARSPYTEQYYATHGLAGDRIALWFYARLVRRLRRTGGRLLDFGCGTGHLLRRLSDHFEAYGYDASPQARGICRLTAPDAVVLEEWQSLPVGSLDVVVCLHTLEHLPHPRATMEALVQRLAAGRHLPVRRAQPGRRRPPPEGAPVVRLPRPDALQRAEPRRVAHAGAPRRPARALGAR